MFVALNIILIALCLLIAYWWANQGLFSAILHLACVVVAGAIALAVWEPITIGLLLRGNAFDDYAWGSSLIGIFLLALFILRVAMDKLIPNNVELPHWANLGFGLPVGALSGVITIGIIMTGAGMIQSTSEIMGFKGVARGQGGRIGEQQKLWAPFHEWTYEFYSFLSVGSLYPTFNDTPLGHYNPDLHAMAASLMRDSAVNGRAKLALRPADAKIEEVIYDAGEQRYAVRVQFEAGARDGGEQLTLSSAQVRLIGRASGFNEAKTVHPDRWTQYTGRHFFDDLSHFVTSEPGQARSSVVFEFPARELGGPNARFIQIRGTRFRLPAARDGSISAVASSIQTGGNATVDPSARNIQSAVKQNNSIPVQVSTNQKPSNIQVNEERYIVSGDGEFVAQTGGIPSRHLVIQGIFEPEKTRIVKVDIRRESPATIFGAILDAAPPNAQPMLVDDKGRTYLPIGFIHTKPDGRSRVKVDFQRFITTSEIPPLPTAGGQPLDLLFCVTEGNTIVGFKLGETTIGTCNLPIADPKVLRNSGNVQM